MVTATEKKISSLFPLVFIIVQIVVQGELFTAQFYSTAYTMIALFVEHYPQPKMIFTEGLTYVTDN